MTAVIEADALRAPRRSRRSTTLAIGCVLVGTIVAVAVVSRNPQVFGLDSVVPESSLKGDSVDVPAGTELKAGERKVGWVTSVVRSPRVGQVVALGYVHRDFLAPGTELDAGGATARVSALPFP